MIRVFCFVLLTGFLCAEPKPLIKDFVGLNGHYHFKPELYSQVCRLVRNYQDMHWDVARPGDPVTYPKCVNGVNWQTVYERWKAQGFEINVCAQFGSFGPANPDYEALWAGQLDWAQTYASRMARVLSEEALASSIEIGNEPGSDFDDGLYRELFKRMARGIREAAPDMRIVTCSVHTAPANKYHKNLDETFSAPEILPLYDVINLHVYAEKPKADQRHPWERSYPEDPAIDYLDQIDAAIKWRNAHAPGKAIWVTEFGYDACSEAAMAEREGWSKKLGWEGVSELQQAQYLVRSLLCFASRDVERAYIYFYNDEDRASTHAASGLTRHFEPKPAFWAVSQFYRMLGDYRFSRTLREVSGELYAYEFILADDPQRCIWVFWSPTGDGRETEVHLRQLPSRPKSLRSMALDEASAKGEGPAILWQVTGEGIRFEVGESPVYLVF